MGKSILSLKVKKLSQPNFNPLQSWCHHILKSWKTTSIFLKIKADPIFLATEDDLKFLKWRMTSIFLKIKDKLNFLGAKAPLELALGRNIFTNKFESLAISNEGSCMM